jgi:signal transduction histidine kinase
MLKHHLTNAALILFFVLGYIFLIVELHPMMGNALYILTLFPVLLVGWLYGSAAGLLAGVLSYLLNLFVASAIKDPLFVISVASLLGTAAIILMGGLVGYLSELIIETKRANAELQKMDKVKDEFLSIMTHDLKSPLVAVLGYSEMLLGGLGGQLGEKQRSFIETIKNQGWHLQSMIDGLLDYTRAEFGTLSPKQENFSLNNLVMEEIKAFLPEANQRKISLEYSPPADQVMITADEKMIDEVITNLLSNALKYSAEGGRATVSLGRGDGSVFFRVSDAGKGIAPDKIGRVFDKYFMVQEETAREKRSLGLGLYIAKKFIEAHHGTITVESPGEGKGTTFSFTLPL